MNIADTYVPANRFESHDTKNRLHRKANATALVPPTNTLPSIDNLNDIFGLFIIAQSLNSCLLGHLFIELFKYNDELNCSLDVVWCNVLELNNLKLK